MTKGPRYGTARKASQGRTANNRKRLRAVRAQPSVPSEKGSSSAPASSVGTAKQAIPQYPHIGDELKKIGIIAGALLVVMVILSQVL